MFEGSTLPDVDGMREVLTDNRDDLDITKREANEITEEESNFWNSDSSELQLSLSAMSTRLRMELASDRAARRSHEQATGEGKDTLGDESPNLERTFPTLIPGLPMDLAESCLARVPWNFQPKLMCVCKTWAAYFMSDNIFSVRSEEKVSESLLLVLSVPMRLGPLRLTVFDAQAATTLEWHKPLAVFDYLGRWSGFLRGFRCAVVGPDLFIIGGRHDGLQYATGKSVWRFNFVTRKWTEAAPMHVARRDFACAVIDDRIYVAGGTDSNRVLPQGHGARSALKSAEMYDYGQDRWHKLPDLKTERVGCLGVALEGRFYVIGGGTDNGTVEFKLFRSAEVLDTSEPPEWKTIDGMWQSHVKLPRAVAGFDHSLFAVDSKDQTLKSYDEITNEWRHVMPMPSSSTILPERSGLAEQQQAMGGLPGDQLLDFPREGLFWMGPCTRLPQVHEHRFLRLHESADRRNCWSGDVSITVERDDGSPSTSSTSQPAAPLPGKPDFRSFGRNSYLIIGSGIVCV